MRHAGIFKRTIYFFLLPAFLLYIIFWVLPVIMTFGYSFTNWSGVGNEMKFIGFKNFDYLLKDGTMINVLKNTFIYTLFSIIYGNIISLTLTILLDENLKLKGVFRTVFYIPTLYSSIVIGFLWGFVYMPNYGVIAQMLKLIGIANADPNFLGNPTTALIAVAFVESWKSAGIYTIIIYSWIKKCFQ